MSKTIKRTFWQQILKTAGAEAGVEEGAAAEGEVTVEGVEAEVVVEVGAEVEFGGGVVDMIRIAETQTDTMIELFAFVYVFSHSEGWSNKEQGTLILSFIVNRSFVFQAHIALWYYLLSEGDGMILVFADNDWTRDPSRHFKS